MKLKQIILTLSVMTSFSLMVNVAHAEAPALNNLNANYGVNWTSCSTCHTSAPALNAFGQDFFASGGSKPAYTPNWNTLDQLDSDNDGITNAQEFIDGTEPAGGSVATPTGTASTTGCMTASLTTPLMMMLAMLMLGVAIRRK